MTEVTRLPCVTSLDHDPQIILDEAKRVGLTNVVIIGYDADGDEYFISSKADGGAVLWMLERARLKLLQIPDRKDEI